MNYSITEIASIIGSDSKISTPGAGISTLLIDSRSLTEAAGTLFFAITTSTGDGHRYIEDLYAKGVRNFVVERFPEEVASMYDANFLLVSDAVEALRLLSGYHRNRFSPKVITITGSRGKTIVKEWLNQLLHHDFRITRSPRSYNSQIGVPLSLWQLSDLTQLAIIEAGISLPGEMAKLKSIIKPEIGIFTNIGPAHSSGFPSIKEKCQEKASMLDGCKCVIYNGDDPLISSCVKPAQSLIAWSRVDSQAPLFIFDISVVDGQTRYSYCYQGNITGQVDLSLSGAFDLENSIHCLAVMLYLGISPETIRERMSLLHPVGTRLEVSEGVGGSLIIHDSYTSDFSSLSPALDFMRRRCTRGMTLTAIISDLWLESQPTSAVYAEIADLLHRYGVNRLIGIGPEISSYARFFKMDSSFYDSTSRFLSDASPSEFRNELILIKGAPGFHFDKICEMLEKRRHETVLEINLDAVVDNFNSFRSRINPHTGIACMIKASGYGAGSHELARTLQAQGATYLAVAVHDEGAELRRAGISMPILVLNPTVDSLQTIFADRLEPEIFSIDFLRSLIAEAERSGIKDYPVHIKIDSGMHRLGFLKETLPEVIEILKSTDCVVPKSIFSHLCAADDPLDDEYTYGQFRYFDECCAMLTKAFPDRKILRHILNSTGITRFPQFQYDMVRLGIGLYGVKTLDDGSQDDLRPVSSLHTLIISLKHWPAGTSIGYNRRGKLTRDSVIATIPVGYADGINRHLGNGGASFMVRGVLCPTVGNICMDACMIDVTNVAQVAVGDRVEIFGENIPVDAIAKSLGTIPYEVLTSISQRVKRVYYRE